MYKLAISKTAKKQLGKIPQKINEKINISIQRLKTWEGNILKMEGGKHEYRLRVGKYRVIFILENDILYIIDIADRKDVYRF